VSRHSETFVGEPESLRSRRPPDPNHTPFAIRCSRPFAIVHRPEQGTQLKNGTGGERPVAISSELAEIFDDYLVTNRDETTDDYGRNPFISTSRGRMALATMRRLIYRVTAPCFRGKPCPKCTGTSSGKCGESVSPNAIRRGSITHFLSQDVPAEIVGDRMNVTRDVLDKQYDKRTTEVKLEQRRGYLDKI